MTRAAAVRAGLAAGLAVLVTVGFLSIRLADARREAAARYLAAIVSRDERATAAEAAPPARRGVRVCPEGVDTYARAIALRLGLRLLDKDGGVLDVATLARLSGLALTAERRAERAAAGPALPQRMGRRRTVGPDGAPVWQPIDPGSRALRHRAEALSSRRPGAVQPSYIVGEVRTRVGSSRPPRDAQAGESARAFLAPDLR